MASSTSFLFLHLLLPFAFFIDFYNAQTTTINGYLKLPLLHKTSFPSPTQTLSLDTNRLSLLRNKPTVKSPVISGASTGSGQYFVGLRLGSPSQSILLVADTGSDLVWVKCSACRNCSVHPPGTAFRVRQSVTFSPVHCYNPLCVLVPRPGRAPKCNLTRLHSTCPYEYSYADGSVTSGLFVKDNVKLKTSFGKETALEKLAFGCGFRISGPSVSGASFNGAHGVLGLGRGSISFSSQLGGRFGNKFSYCLMDYTLSPPPASFLTIGGAKNVSVLENHKMRYTPFQTNPRSPTFYYVEIKSLIIDNQKLPINPSVWSIDVSSGDGGTIIDSGTTLTFLPEPVYRQILSTFRRRIRLPIPAEPIPGFDLCLNVSSAAKLRLPKLAFVLAGGSVFAPPPRNYFIETEDRVKCLGIQPVNPGSGFSVIGNLMQQGFMLEFDRDKSRLGFSRHGCAVA